MKTRWLLLYFGIAHIIIIIVLFNSSLYDHRYTAAPLYFDYASKVFQGMFPYRDFIIEYPPVSLVFFLLPRLFTADIDIYGSLFIIEMVIIDLIGLVLVAGVAHRFRQSIVLALSVYTLALLAVGPILELRYDLAPAVMVLGAIYALYTGHHKIGWALLGLGTMTKLYPLAVAPIFLLYHLRNHEYRRLLTGAAAFVLVVLLTSYPFLIASPTGFIYSFMYQTSRGLQIETTYASILLFLHNLNVSQLYLFFEWGGWNVGGPAADTLVAISTPVTVVMLLTVYYVFFRTQQQPDLLGRKKEIPDIAYVTNFAAAAIVATMIAGKILSPQFIVWLYPLIPLVVGGWRYLVWPLFLVTGLMTYYIFPPHYLDLLLFNQTAIDVLLWRNIFLAAMGGALIIKLKPQSTWLDEV